MRLWARPAGGAFWWASLWLAVVLTGLLNAWLWDPEGVTPTTLGGLLVGSTAGLAVLLLVRRLSLRPR